MIYVDSSGSWLLFTYMVWCHNEDGTYIHRLLFTLRCCVSWNCLNIQDCCDFRVEAKQWSRDQTLYFWGISVSVEAFSSKCSVSSVEKHTEFYFCAISCYMLLSLFSELLKSTSYENVWKNELSCHEWYM